MWLGAGHSKQKSNKGWGLLFRTHKKFLESFVPLTRYIIHNTKILSKLFSFFLKLFTLNYHNTYTQHTHEHIVTHCILYINMLIIMYNTYYHMYKYTHYSRKIILKFRAKISFRENLYIVTFIFIIVTDLSTPLILGVIHLYYV